MHRHSSNKRAEMSIRKLIENVGKEEKKGGGINIPLLHSRGLEILWTECFIETSAETVVEDSVAMVYYTKANRRFDSLALAKGSTRIGKIYQVAVMDSGKTTRKEVK